MKRHEMWRHRYRQARDLDHLNDEELSARFHDAFNNIRTRSPNGKLGVRTPIDRVGDTWWSVLTEVLEECSLRGYPYLGPLNISKYRDTLEHAFDPIPNMDRIISRYSLERSQYVMKFGELRWLRQTIESGSIRIASAAYYDSDGHNHARRDSELTRQLRLNPHNPNYSATWASVESRSDYYLYSLTETYTPRLFGDFAANACLVVFDRRRFLARLQRAVARQLPGWQVQVSRVNYYDPVRVNPGRIVVPTYKPFRHAYQEELRLICLPPSPRQALEPIQVELGPLDDCADLADLTAYPPVKLPHDPKDDPVQTFGVVTLEDDMMNHLPAAAKIQGLVLNKGAPRHEDWTFQLQYTDSAGTLHDLKMPMRDGLYLLNLLRAAEEEQHLGLWNRE